MVMVLDTVGLPAEEVINILAVDWLLWVLLYERRFDKQNDSNLSKRVMKKFFHQFVYTIHGDAKNILINQNLKRDKLQLAILYQASHSNSNHNS